MDDGKSREGPAPRANNADLRGKTAVVTGSSSGIGRAIAVGLAEAGADVVVHAARNLEGARETQQAVVQCGCEARVLQSDFQDSESLSRFVDQAWEWRDGVAIWVNNAGADVLTGEAASWSFAEKLQQLWEVDVRSTVLLSRAVGERMQARPPSSEPASIINIGWDQVTHGMEGPSGEMFACSKGAIMAFTRSLALSLAPRVRVNCVAPGWIATAWETEASDYWQRRARRECLLERWGTPADVAAAVCFLVSPAAEFINGQELPVNGGFRSAAPDLPPGQIDQDGGRDA